MANGYWIERIEITFWNLSIPLMRRSRLVQAIVQLAFALFERKTRLHRFARVAFWAIAGLVAGLAIGVLKAWFA